MTYNVFSGTLNPTHSLTILFIHAIIIMRLLLLLELILNLSPVTAKWPNVPLFNASRRVCLNLKSIICIFVVSLIYKM